MSAQILTHPAAPLYLCDKCQCSPPNPAVNNIGFELEGRNRFTNRTSRHELHICRDCLRRFFEPFNPGLLRLNDDVTFEPVRGFFVVLPLKRLQRKRR